MMDENVLSGTPYADEIKQYRVHVSLATSTNNGAPDRQFSSWANGVIGII